MFFKFKSMCIAVLALLWLIAGCHSTEPSLKLYVFDCGRLKSGNPAPLIERGLTTTATHLWFFPAARTIDGPPMSICSMASASETSGRAMVSANG